MSSKRFLWGMCGACILATVCCTPAMADSATVSYQGVLWNASGAPVPDGTYPMTFSIWDAASGGTKQWGYETHASVAIKNGLFSVYLGETAGLGTLFSTYSALWLEITADTGSGPETYSPRAPLASVPYARHALNADTVDGQHASAFAAASHNHDGAAITSGTVDISHLPTGTTGTQVALGNHVHSSLAAPDGLPAQALVVDNAGSVGIGAAPSSGAKLQVDGALKFNGDPGTGSGYAGQISKSVRALQVCDPRPDCPNATPVTNTNDLWGQTFTLTNSAAVFATATLIKFGTGRRDLLIAVDGVEQQRSIADTGTSASPVSVTCVWTGVLGPGSHRISVGVANVGYPATTWGCGCGHGQLEILIFE